MVPKHVKYHNKLECYMAVVVIIPRPIQFQAAAE